MKNPFKKIEKDKPVRLKKNKRRNLEGGENVPFIYHFTDEHEAGLEPWQRKKMDETWNDYLVRLVEDPRRVEGKELPLIIQQNFNDREQERNLKQPLLSSVGRVNEDITRDEVEELKRKYLRQYGYPYVYHHEDMWHDTPLKRYFT